MDHSYRLTAQRGDQLDRLAIPGDVRMHSAQFESDVQSRLRALEFLIEHRFAAQEFARERDREMRGLYVLLAVELMMLAGLYLR